MFGKLFVINYEDFCDQLCKHARSVTPLADTLKKGAPQMFKVLQIVG